MEPQMANENEPRSEPDRNLFGGIAPERYVEAPGSLRFVLDGNTRFASADPEFEKFYGAPTRPGDAFDPERVLRSRPVLDAIQLALDGTIPERRLVLFPRAEDRESVWIFEAFPFEASQLAEGKGVIGIFARCEVSSGRSSLDEMLFSVTLAERLARERLGTAKAVVATIRHEISNALTTIIGNAELILRKSPSSDESRSARIQEIVTQGRRIQLVIEKLDALTDVRTTKHYGGYEMLDLELQSESDEPGNE